MALRMDALVEWKGGKCPVPPLTPVIVLFRDGRKSSPSRADLFIWEWFDDEEDIVGYYVVQ